MLVAVIEDDPIIARSVSKAVKGAGHECVCVDDGEAAIRDETILSSDLVILDLMLPGTDGVEVLRAARSHGSRTPVIVLTARGSIDEKLEAFEAGADDYLPKPFDPEEMELRVRALLRRSGRLARS
jgi:two-component system response regulator TctD